MFKKRLTIVLAILSLMTSLISVVPKPVLAANSQPPTIASVYPGASSTITSPPSETLAVSPKEKFEFLNSGYEIITPRGKILTGSNQSLVGTNGVFLSDPQVMWDPTTKRFYYSIFENRGTTQPDEGIAWGFSKTANPTKPGSFCSYFSQFNYGSSSFPDRQSLGDTSDFLLIGSNRYAADGSDSFLGSDLAWISKPPAGKTCPDVSSFSSGIQSLHNPDGSSPYTPTPAKQVDPNATGWVASVPSYNKGITQNSLTLWNVSNNAANGAAVISTPQSLATQPYTTPPYARQAGVMKNGNPAMPLQTRVYLTQMIMAYDPRVGHDALWTDHTVASGAGDGVQWFEINPWNNALDQTGIITSPSLDVYNGTISPDRVVRGSTKKFGSSAIMTVNTSSSTAYTAVQMTSIVDGQTPSPLAMVKQSAGPNADFSCFEPATPYCRWGDYSGAVPDPSAPIRGQTHGRVWFTNQWNLPDIDDQTPTWQTTIWQSQF